MRTLGQLLATIMLVYSVGGNPARTIMKAGEIANGPMPVNREQAAPENKGPLIIFNDNSTRVVDAPADGTLITVGTTESTQPAPIDINGQRNNPSPSLVEVFSTTTAVSVSVATVGAIATETIQVGTAPDVDSDDNFAASAAIGSSDPISIDNNATDAVTFGKTNTSDSPIVAILGSNDTIPFNSSESDSSIVAILGAEDSDADDDDMQPTGALPLVGDGSLPIIIGKRLGKRQMQAVTENMPNSDSITFQTHAGDGFVQPQIVPIFQQVVDTTTTDTTTTSSSTSTTDISTTLTSGTTTTTTTSWTSATGTTTSTTTTWTSSSTTATPGVAVVTTWSTASLTTCIPAESHTSAPPVPASCIGTTTLCTITVAYVISMNPTTTSYYTTPFNTAAIAGTTATQTIYSEDPNGFHVYITTLDNSNGAATATYFFTTPEPTRIAAQINIAVPTAPDNSMIYTGFAIFWSLALGVIL
ncbi:hypothetical protein ABW20_dc0106083 [Dactylellina cionopaga]|nr:hypothetical protein ABW20_dc0106083 [Dactylellina cionopaga]